MKLKYEKYYRLTPAGKMKFFDVFQNKTQDIIYEILKPRRLDIGIEIPCIILNPTEWLVIDKTGKRKIIPNEIFKIKYYKGDL